MSIIYLDVILACRVNADASCKLFPEILGKLLTRALTLEHRQITEDITSLIVLGDNTGFDQISQHG